MAPPEVAVAVCPIATTTARPEAVWRALTEDLGRWIDGRVVSGRMAAGERVVIRTSGFGLTFTVRMHVLEIDPAEGRLRLDVHLPFGIVNHETVSVAAVAGGTRIAFG